MNIKLFYTIIAILLCSCGNSNSSSTTAVTDMPADTAVDLNIMAEPEMQKEQAGLEEPEKSKEEVAVSRLFGFMVERSDAISSVDECFAWMKAVNDSVMVYNKRIGRKAGRRASQTMAIEDMREYIDPMSGGSQYEMNLYTYYEALLSFYKTVNMYNRLIADVENESLKNLLYDDFKAWYRITNEQNYLLNHYTYRGARYSSLPIDINETYKTWVDNRFDELVVCRNILVKGASFNSASAVIPSDSITRFVNGVIRYWMGAIDPEREKEYIRSVRAGTYKDLPDREPLHKSALEFESALSDWLEVRENIASQLPLEQRESYMALTRQVYGRFYAICKRLSDRYYDL